MQHVDPYKSSNELGITLREREALIAVLHDMEQPDAAINMRGWSSCICGKMYIWRLHNGDAPFVHSLGYSESLQPLFFCHSSYWGPQANMRNVNAKDAAGAIRTFLLGMTIGDFGELVSQ